jgi:hypothetical protein
MRHAVTLFFGFSLALACVSGCSDDGPPRPADSSVDDGAVRPDGITVGDGPIIEGDAPKGCAGGCKSPPKTRCVDGDTLRVYESEGFCENDSCHYGFKDETCADGCEDNQCKGSPCQGVTCDKPPASVCADADNLRVYESPGSCDKGSCLYKDKLVPCQNGCDNGQCKGDPCAGVSCNAPPKNSCVDASTLRSFEGQGSCSGGTCSYGHKDVTCPFGCELGACKNDPCAGVSCNSPPASYCSNATTLRSFASPGSCAGGSCTYAKTDTTCAFGCDKGACKGDPCAGKSCTTPPASYCADATTLRSFASPGSCAGGSCTYIPSDTPCAFGCQNGSCKGDPCVGKSCTTPPASHCKDASTLRSYANLGSCQNGVCSYTPTDTPCAHGCALGACQADPCVGVSCVNPPTDSCTSGSALRVYAKTGICQGGACSYPYSDQLCPGGCAAGVCNGPSCGGNVCNSPPANSCESASVAKTYAPIGSCNGTSCDYQEIRILCSEGCFNGGCIAGSQQTEYIPIYASLTFVAMDLDATGAAHLLGCGYSPGLVYRHKTLSGWQQEQIEAGSSFCTGAIAVDAQGVVHMAYYDGVNKDVRYGRWENGVLQKELVATKGDRGYDIALTLDAAGKPVIAYYGEDGQHSVYVATRGASSWISTAIHSQTAKLSGNLELRADSGGDLHVLFDDTAATSIYLRGKGSNWTAQTLPTGRKISRSLAFTPAGERRYTYVTNNQLYQRSISAAGASLGDEYIAKSAVPFTYLPRYWPASLLTSSFAEYVKTDLGLWDRQYRFSAPQYSKLFDGQVGNDKRARLVASIGSSSTWGVITEPVCTPSCPAGACGSDGCGGSCGSCSSGNSCSPAQTCTGWKYERIGPIATSTTNTTFEFSGSDVHIFDSTHHYRYANGSWSIVTPPFSGEPFATTVDGTGKLHAAWFTTPSFYGGPIYVSTFENGAWTPSKAVGANGYAGIDIRVDGAGTYHIFHGRRQQTYNYSTLYTTFDGTTATTKTVHSSTAGSRIQIARDSGGKWHVFWFDYTSLRYSTDVSGSWVHSVVDYDASSYSPHTYRLMQDGSGGLHVCFWDNTKHKPIYARKNGASWDKESLPGTTGAYCAMDSTGKVVAADKSLLYTRTGTNTWSSDPIPVNRPGSTGSWAHHRPAAAFDGANKLHLFHVFYVGSDYYAYHGVR